MPTPPLPHLAAMQLLDSAAPTGAFAHSMGFETYMERGVIDSPDTFAAWLESFVRHQLAFTDAVAVRLAWAAESFDEVRQLDRLLDALTIPAEAKKANAAMGKRLLTIAASNYAPEPEGASWLVRYQQGVDKQCLKSHPAIVWGITARELGLDSDAAVSYHLYATAISLTQNAVRAIPLGQDAGQRIQRRAQAWIADATEASRGRGIDDLGAAVPGLEIAQMQHAQQRARLFMS